jgi:SAM-dependent methyltransferase
VTTWKLFEGDAPAFFSAPEFFRDHPWVPPEIQTGHAERLEMVSALVHRLAPVMGIGSVTDLGCGDGSLLGLLTDLGVPCWGYDLGEGNIRRAAACGVDVRRGNILEDDLACGDLIVASEVAEHLADPESFLRSLPPCKALVLSSPSAETGEWHYEHHAWAWDLAGYRDLVAGCGWTVQEQVECDGGINWHGGVTAPQRFQAVVATR